MKIVQSFWSKPYFSSSRPSSRKLFTLMSWAFSCLQLRKFNDDLELITDNRGKEILIDKLHLPYTKVSTSLEDINDYDESLWAIGKIHAYQQQAAPFLHVDGDVFVFDEFDEKCQVAPLVALHPHNAYLDSEFTQTVMLELHAAGVLFPRWIQRKPAGMQFSINAGIIGGNDVAFFQQFSAEAFRFVKDNIHKIHGDNRGDFNTIFEQLLFYEMVQDKPIHYGYNNDWHLYSFANAFEKNQLVHGRSDIRQQNGIIEALLFRLMMQFYPSYFFTINDLLTGPDRISPKTISSLEQSLQYFEGSFIKSHIHTNDFKQITMQLNEGRMLIDGVFQIDFNKIYDNLHHVILRYNENPAKVHLPEQEVRLSFLSFLVICQLKKPASIDKVMTTISNFLRCQSMLTQRQLMAMLNVDTWERLQKVVDDQIEFFIKDCIALGILRRA
jgi:hypothetical protein